MKIGCPLFEVPDFMSTEDKSDLSPSVAMPSSKAALAGAAMLECRCPARHNKCRYSDLFSSRG